MLWGSWGKVGPRGTMLLGEYDHTLDEKNRLTLPARFRVRWQTASFSPAGSTPASRPTPRGLAATGRVTARRPQPAQPRDPHPRALLLHGRRRGGAGQAGPRDAAADADRARGARSRGGRRRDARTHRDLGSRRVARPAEGGQWEVQSMLPNVLQPNTTDHVPVLADEVRALLALEPGHTLVDATFGAGGHATPARARPPRQGKVIAIDRDPTVRPYFERFRRTAGVERALPARRLLDRPLQLAENGVRADAILLDLGVSSMQLDRPERGFSYAADAPLDMRMDPSAEYSARELVNEARSASSSRSSGATARSASPARSPARSAAGGASSRSSARRARRHDQGGDSRPGQVRRGSPGQARLPGPADRGERGARTRSRTRCRRRSRCSGRVAASP